MSVRYVIGRAGYGKTTFCLREICAELRERPEGSPLIWIVPEQASFQAESAILQDPHLRGSIRAEVLGFRRLAHRLMQQVKGTTRPYIDDAGKGMILLKVINKVADQLRFYRSQAISDGLLAQMGELFAEWKRNGVQSEHFSSFMESEQALQMKLEDLLLLYHAFEEELSKHYVDAEDDLQLLATLIPNSEHIRQATIWVDGFHGYTPLEMQVLAQLAIHCQQLTITFCLDRHYDRRERLDDLNLFYRPASTYQQMQSICHTFEIVAEPIIDLNEPAAAELTFSRRAGIQMLRHLEANFDKLPIVTAEHADDSVQVVAAVNRRIEVEGVAAEMLRAAREEHVRFRDMTVLVRNLDDYLPLMKDIFGGMNIPYFSDQTRSVADQPLVEFVRASLQTVHRFWRYEDLFRAIKTGFFLPMVDDEERDRLQLAMDELENVVIAAGLVRKRWLTDSLWQKPLAWYGSTMAESRWQQIVAARELVLRPLLTLQKQLAAAQDVRAAVQAIYDYLCALQIPEKCMAQAERLRKEGQLSAADDHVRIWSSLIHLFDQNVDILGDQPFRTTQWIRMFDRALETLKLGFVPPAMDQVLIGTLDRTRAGDVKRLFVLGVNEGVLPARIQERGLFSDAEREQLIASDVPMSPGSLRKVLDESFLFYTALATCSERLWVSYCLGNEGGRGLVASAYIQQLKEMFPALEEAVLELDYAKMSDEEWLRWIQHPRQVVDAWIQTGRRADPLVASLAEQANWAERLAWLRRAQLYDNRARSLSPAQATALYGQPLKGSVSRFEQFSACSFAHYAQYGLKLRERRTFELQAMDVGNLYHHVIESVIRSCQQSQQALTSLDTQQMQTRVQQAIAEVVGEVQHSILTSSPEHQYTMEKLARVVFESLSAMAIHEQHSQFEIRELEWAFDYTLDELHLRGRIDRLDVACDDDGQHWIRVIDFKSGAKTLDLDKVFHGLSLQLIAYLDIAAETAPDWYGYPVEIAGAFYFQVHDKLVPVDHPPEGEELEKTLRKRYKMSGYLVDQMHVIGLMDCVLKGPSANSDILPIRTVKDGSVHGTYKRHLLSQEQWQSIRSYVRQKMKSVASRMLAGETDIMPYKLKNQTPCEYCAVRSVCQFDRLLPSQSYRYLAPLDREQSLERMS
jgi:ATP-dependent helicase/nuclease subunit B